MMYKLVDFFKKFLTITNYLNIYTKINQVIEQSSGGQPAAHASLDSWGLDIANKLNISHEKCFSCYTYTFIFVNYF